MGNRSQWSVLPSMAAALTAYDTWYGEVLYDGEELLILDTAHDAAVSGEPVLMLWPGQDLTFSSSTATETKQPTSWVLI